MRAKIGTARRAVSSVDGVRILLIDTNNGREVASALSNASGSFTFEDVSPGDYKLKIDQDEFAAVAYAVDTEVVHVGAKETVSIGLPVVKRVKLPSYPQPTIGNPVAQDPNSGRVYMAVDQGLLVYEPANDTVDLLYTSSGFRSEQGPRLLSFVPGSRKLVLVTPTRAWVISESVFSDDNVSEVINYDDPAMEASLKDEVQHFDIDPTTFIKTGRPDSGEFDPHYYRFESNLGGTRIYLAAGNQAAVIDLDKRQVARVFKSSGRLAHYSAQSNRLYFLQAPATVRIVDADTLQEVVNHNLETTDPYRLLGVSSRPSTGDGYVAYTRINTSNQEVLFLLVVSPSGEIKQHGKAAEILGAGEAKMEPGVPHWQETGDRFIVGDSLFELAGDQFSPVATGAILESSLEANDVTSNKARSADVPSAILVSYLGNENAAVGMYFLDGANPAVGVRVVRGKVPVVTLDERHGRGFVFGNGALSVIYYNAPDVMDAQALVDLRNVGQQLLGGESGAPCDSGSPCPDEGVCAPVDEFNTDEGTCTTQVRRPFKRFCGGITGVACDPGFDCRLSNPTNTQSFGECMPMACDPQHQCPTGFYCGNVDGTFGASPDGSRTTDSATGGSTGVDAGVPPPPPPGSDPTSTCPADDPLCKDQGTMPGGSGQCICYDLATCGPTCAGDDQCPAGFVCANGHCAIHRCLNESSCPLGKVCGVTEAGRACVDRGSNPAGASCVSSSECDTAYCRAGTCAQSCGKTADCPSGKECIGGEWVGYCDIGSCGCGPDEMCLFGRCEAGVTCAIDSDCPNGGACWGGRCKDPCTVSGDCAADEVCMNDATKGARLFCTNLHEGGAAVYCREEGREFGCSADKWCNAFNGQCMTGTPCAEWEANSCPDGQSCQAGTCRASCHVTGDCREGEICVRGYRDSSLFCASVSENWCKSPTGESPGCSAESWCNPAIGQCMTGTPCEEWQPNSCPTGQVCVAGACMVTCSASTECPDGEECTGGWGSPAGTSSGKPLLTCRPARCHCPQRGDVCMSWSPDQLGECWNWENCNTLGICADKEHYSCNNNPFDGTPRCQCKVTDYCGSRCVYDGDCQDNYKCDVATGQCIFATCQSDAECDPGEVCGVDESWRRVCVIPGTRVVGAYCERSSECASGGCVWNWRDGRKVCIQPCTFTADCPQGMLCATSRDGMGGEKSRTCVTVSKYSCAPDEYAMNSDSTAADGGCTKGVRCEPNQIGMIQCLAHESCQWSNEGYQVCVCNDDTCKKTCSRDTDCGDPAVGCHAGLCRPLSRCVADTDCDSPRACGLIDGQEATGPRCVTPGPQAAGQQCKTHSECASGFCSEGTCRKRCSATQECGSGEECRATKVLDKVAVGACQAATCGCSGADACNLGGECGQGPICNRDEDCGTGKACVNNLCRALCQKTEQCAQGQSCTGLGGDRPHVCLANGCGCSGDQVCEGTTCFTAKPCRDDSTCGAGRCVGGQCFNQCKSTKDCAAGLECVAVSSNPNDFWSTRFRVCSAPECGCHDPNAWCMSTKERAEDIGWRTAKQCFTGSDCNGCPWDPKATYNCIGTRYPVADLPGQACGCFNNLETCGPTCTSHAECPDGYQCDNGGCKQTRCASDADCPQGLTCGTSRDDFYTMVCRVPGSKADASECSHHGECASGSCINNRCVNRCTTTSDCGSGEACTYGASGYYDIASCTSTATQGSCPSGCGAGEWCYNGQCRSGRQCFSNYSNCATDEVCDYVSCLKSCKSSLDCSADTECILLDTWTSTPVTSNAACKKPDCHCRNRADRCRSDGYTKECFRPVTCNFMSTCDSTAGSEYACDNNKQACTCSNQAICGPSCLSHADCRLGEVCETSNGTCLAKRCQRDSECPAGSTCASNGYSRFCSRVETKPDGATCGQWNECASGMCYQSICVDPCVDNGDCKAGTTCQMYAGNDYPFCLAWTTPCSCSSNQFCDASRTCRTGPACSDSQDCASGRWCDWYSRSCQ
ncbi:MAG: carboxypeptidase regulatory-like domain-containing protein [Deltaproteobacteria bacterium]|nr:carboxypeptidase regulatory-like domain-containing protein [Deltaproteobacteria bacterium]